MHVLIEPAQGASRVVRPAARVRPQLARLVGHQIDECLSPNDDRHALRVPGMDVRASDAERDAVVERFGSPPRRAGYLKSSRTDRCRRLAVTARNSRR